MTINSTTRKTSNLVGNGNTHTYPFAFKVFQDSEVVVKKLEVSTSIETTLTLGANNDYIVTLNEDQNGNPGGSITLKSGGNNQNLASGFQIVITSAVQSLQGTDLTNQGGFYPEVINDALDKSAILHQQQQDELDRSIKFSLTNTIGSLEITENANARKNRVLGFDNLGEFEVLKELGTYRGNWAASTAYAVRDLVKDTSTNNIFFCNTAHTSSGSQPLTTNTNSANWDLIVDAGAATTSATNAASSATAAASSATAAASSQTAAASSQSAAASSATAAASSASTASTQASNASTSASAAQTAQTAAETALDSFDDRYLGAKANNPTVDNDGNALIDGALYFNTTVNRMRVYDLGNTTWLEVTISGSDLTNTNTVAGSISNVNAVGGNISNVNAVASNATNINAVNSNSSNINTVAGAASNINNVSGSIANVNTVGGAIANVNTVAAEINNNKLQTVANNINAVVTAADDLNEATSEIDTVANNIANVNNVGNSISNVNTVAGAISNVNAVASNASNVNAVGGAITNVNNVGGSIANVNTCANNLSGINSFAERYRTDNTGNNPSSNNDAGDLFFNQASGKLLVYNANTSAWEETQSVGNFFINTISSFSGTGGNSATFNNSAYKFTLSNAGQFAQQMLVSINGVVQKPNSGTGQPSEGFALDGANIVFSAAPPTGADYFIVTIGASVSIGTPSDNTVTSAKIVDGTIVNADINASAAIAGTKIAPDFGSQNIVTTGAFNSGSVTITGGSPAITFTDSNNDPDYYIQNNNGALRIYDATNSAERFVVNTDGHVDVTGNLDVGAGIDVTGEITATSHLDMPDNAKIKLGTGDDLEIYHDGTDSYIQSKTNDLFIDNDGDDIVIRTADTIFMQVNNNENCITCLANGSVELYYDNSKKLETTSYGARVYGNFENHDGNITVKDAGKFTAGNSDDLQIYHDGSNNYIDGNSAAEDHIYIRANVGSDHSSNIHLQAKAGEESIVCRDDEQVELYHDGTKKLETTSYGSQVTGYQVQTNFPVASVTSSSAIDLSNVVLTSSNFYNQTHINQGSHFDASTGKFTCPVDGVYRIFFRASEEDSTSTNVRLQKNGVTINEAYDKSGNNSVSSEAVIGCSANDYLQIQVNRLKAVSGGQHKQVTFQLIA